MAGSEGISSLERDIFREILKEQRDNQALLARQGEQISELGKKMDRFDTTWRVEDASRRMALIEARLDALLDREESKTQWWWKVAGGVVEKLIVALGFGMLGWWVAHGGKL